MDKKFEKNTFGRRLRTMLAVDFRRMLTTPLFYITLGICLVAPILILVMTTMMDGQVTVDPQTKVETVIEGFDNVWQVIATPMADMGTGGMSMTAMCNINLVYMGVCAFICLFVAEDFRSGFSKNLFSTRSKKGDYVISKTLVGIVTGCAMLVAFFIGSMLGGAISSLPFALGDVTPLNVVWCLLSKLLLIAVFVPIYLIAAVAAKGSSWLSILVSLAGGMLLFMMIPMITPLDATPINAILTLVGGLIFSIGLGFISKAILEKTALV